MHLKTVVFNQLKTLFPSMYEQWVKLHNDKQRASWIQILNQDTPPSYYDSEIIFDKLQNEYSGVPEYGYDAYSTWKRGVDRANELLKLGNLIEAPKKILEAGCGDGMTSYALNGFGHQLTLLDMDDWRDGRAKGLEFHKVDLNKTLPLQDEQFDLIFSFNTFEHLPDPALTLQELMRLCKPGGYIYLEFGPLYASPWGLHAYRMLKMPYPQFLFSNEFILNKLKTIGINDLGNDNREELQYVNKWTYQQYCNLFNQYQEHTIEIKTYRISDHLRLIDNYSKAFTGQGLMLDDLCAAALKVILNK